MSVIIPCINAEATIGVQLAALAAQQWSQPWELIIADNGSSDNTLDVARRYQDRFAAFQIIHASAQRSSFHARNAGVRAARSNRIAFCDADDEVEPGWVASIGDALEHYDVVYGLYRFDKFNEPSEAEKASQGWKDGLYHGRFLPGGATANLGINRWVHEAIGGFDECLPRFGDADYFYRLQLEGFTLHYVPEASVQLRNGRVKPSLAYMFWRGRTASAANHWLYLRYAPLGMLPPNSLRKSLIGWLSILKGFRLRILLDRNRKQSWMRELFFRCGDLFGQLQARAVNPCSPYLPADRLPKKEDPQRSN